MKTRILETIAKYYILTGESIRSLTKVFNKSKTTIHKYLYYDAKNNLPKYITDLISKRSESNKNEIKLYGKLLEPYEYNEDVSLSDNSMIGLYAKPFCELNEEEQYKCKSKNRMY